MATMTLQIPSSQIGWFEQMVRTMGWAFQKTMEDETFSSSEAELAEQRGRMLDDFVSRFRTDDLSEEEILAECKAVRRERYERAQAH